MPKIKVKQSNRYLSLAAVLLALLFWLILYFIVGEPVLVPSPMDVGKKLIQYLQRASFYPILLRSIAHVFMGFGMGFVFGGSLAAMSCRSNLSRILLRPYISAISSVPVASFVVLALLWLPSEKLSVLISALIVFPVAYQNIFRGLWNVNEELLQMSSVFQASALKRLRYIVLPQLRPYLESTLSSCFGMAIKAGVAAEIIATPTGTIGKLLYESKIYLDSAALFAVTLMIILAERLCEKLLSLLCRWFYDRLVFSKRARKEKSAWDYLRQEPQRVLISNMKQDEKNAEEYSKNIPKGEAAVQKLRIRNLLLGYDKEGREEIVLKNFNAVFEKEKLNVLTGRSGIGKTSLLKAICGFLEPKSGEILAENGDKTSRVWRGKSEGISMVFQEDRLCEEFCALDNLYFAYQDREKTECFCSRLLEEMGLGELLLTPVKQMSGGQKRRVAIARALVAEAELLILDEPLRGLDEETQKQVLYVIEKYSKGRMRIMVTHDADEEGYISWIGREKQNNLYLKAAFETRQKDERENESNRIGLN